MRNDNKKLYNQLAKQRDTLANQMIHQPRGHGKGMLMIEKQLQHFMLGEIAAYVSAATTKITDKDICDMMEKQYGDFVEVKRHE